MTVTILYKKVEDSCIDEIKNSSKRQFSLHKFTIVVLATLFPRRLLTVFVSSLPWRLVLRQWTRNLIQQNSFNNMKFIATNRFRRFAIKALSVKANSWIIFYKNKFLLKFDNGIFQSIKNLPLNNMESCSSLSPIFQTSFKLIFRPTEIGVHRKFNNAPK